MEDEVFLVLLNVRKEDISSEQYGLTLESGPLTGPVDAISHLGISTPHSPEINESGGFTNYIPFENLPPKSFAIIQLIP
jgi:hypothetical protein